METTRKFRIAIVKRSYANSPESTRTITGNMIITGTENPGDLIHAIRVAVVKSTATLHTIGKITITISPPKI